jgi:polar amino acid transport system permease protein
MTVFFDNVGYILRGAEVTAYLAIAAILLGTMLGLAISLVLLLAGGAVRAAMRSMTFSIRGMPVLVSMFVLYFFLPNVGVDLSGTTAVGIALVIYVACFYSEVFRGAVETLPRGQYEAGIALGMSRLETLRSVLLPQALPAAVAPWLNISVIAVKSTAYASIVGVWELTYAAKEVVERTAEPFSIFFGVMLIYFVICFPISLCARRFAPKTTGAQNGS